MTIRPTAPLNTDRGKFFPFQLLAFTNATPQEAYRFSLGASGSGVVPLRNAMAFHAQLATVAEGLLERIVIPYQSGSTSFDSFGALRESDDDAANLENLLRGALSETLRGVSTPSAGPVQRDNRMNDIRRFEFAEVWTAVNTGARALMYSEAVRTIELNENGAAFNIDIYPPCVPVSPNGGCHGFTGFETTLWNAGRVGAINLDNLNLQYAAQPLLAFCADGSSFGVGDVLRDALAEMFVSLGGISACNITYATPRAFWDATDGILARHDVFGSWPAGGAKTIAAVENAPATRRANLDLMRTSQAIMCLCAANFAKVPVAWSHPHAETTVVYNYTVAPDGTCGEPRTSTMTGTSSGVSIEYERGIYAAPPVGWEYERWIPFDCISEEHADGPTTLYDVLRNPDNDDRYYTVDGAGLPAATAAQSAEIARLQQVLSDAEAATADAQYDYDHAETDAERAAALERLSAAQAAEKTARTNLRNYVGNLDLDCYITVNLAQNENLWRVVITGDNPFDPHGADPIPAARSIACQVEARLLVPSGTSGASTVTTWPAADAFAQGYVLKEQLVAAERYSDDVHLYESATDASGVTRWVARRTIPSGRHECYRVHAAFSSGTPGTNTASAIAASIAIEARAGVSDIFDTSSFTLPVPISPTTEAEVRPTLAQFEHEARSTLTARLCFNRYLSTTLRNSIFPRVAGDGEDLDKFVPYKAEFLQWDDDHESVDLVECWEYGQAKMNIGYWLRVAAHSQRVSTPTFSEGFCLAHSAKALAGVTWNWKSMPCETNEQL